MGWRRPGDKPLSAPMMVSLWRIYASLGLNELNNHVAVTYYKCPHDMQMARNRSALDSVLAPGAFNRDITVFWKQLRVMEVHNTTRWVDGTPTTEVTPVTIW